MTVPLDDAIEVELRYFAAAAEGAGRWAEHPSAHQSQPRRGGGGGWV